MLRSLVSDFEPVRRALLAMLKPSDIVSLMQATGLVTTDYERRQYLQWTREVFHTMKWVNKLKVEGCTITVIGKDLHDFNRAVRSWSRVPSTLRVLIVVNCPSWATTKLLRELHSLGESLSMPYIWTVESNVPPTDNATRHNPSEQACVIFTSRNTSIELDPAWSEKVLAMEQSDEISDKHNYTWYTNLQEPTPWLERSPDSHHNLRGIVEVLRRHGEEGKFLLSSRKYKSRTFFATSQGIPLTAETN